MTAETPFPHPRDWRLRRRGMWGILVRAQAAYSERSQSHAEMEIPWPRMVRGSGQAIEGKPHARADEARYLVHCENAILITQEGCETMSKFPLAVDEV